jgi:hypothetical protein
VLLLMPFPSCKECSWDWTICVVVKEECHILLFISSLSIGFKISIDKGLQHLMALRPDSPVLDIKVARRAHQLELVYSVCLDCCVCQFLALQKFLYLELAASWLMGTLAEALLAFDRTKRRRVPSYIRLIAVSGVLIVIPVLLIAYLLKYQSIETN